MAQSNKHVVQSPLELKGLAKYVSLVCHRSMARAVWTFTELGIADLMANHQAPITASELSRLNGNHWNAEFLYRLLRVTADADLVKISSTADQQEGEGHPEDAIRFQLTDDGVLLTSDHPSKAYDLIRSDFGPISEKTASYLPALIKCGFENGNGFEQAHGSSLFDYMQKDENKDCAAIFNNSMISYSNYMSSSFGDTIDFTGFRTLVDIAGGLGTLLATVLDKHRNLNGVLFDMEHVIEQAKQQSPTEFERKQIEPNRYAFVAGDMFNAETIPPADAYMLKFILHDWNDEESMKILKSIRCANASQTEQTITVFIVEMVISSNDKDSWQSHVFDMEMLCITGSKERTLAQYVSLLDKSGYRFKRLHSTTNLMSVIEAQTTSERCA